MRFFASPTVVFRLALIWFTIFGVAQSAGNGASTRVVGGRLARKNEVPYIVALYSGLKWDAHQFCGGSIYNKRFIITAAHCLMRYSNGVPSFRVIAGTTDHTKTEGAQVINVIKYIEHPGFMIQFKPPLKAFNDITLLKLERDLEFNDGVQPIPIPPTGTVSSGKAILSGWGSTAVSNNTGNEGERSNQLLTVEIAVVPRPACEKYFREIAHKDVWGDKPNSTEIGLPIPHEKVLCAGTPEEGGKDQCGGDSGGPLQCSRKIGGKPEKYLCGVVSYGQRNSPIFGCGLKLPGLYTDVAQFHDWIVENTKE